MAEEDDLYGAGLSRADTGPSPSQQVPRARTGRSPVPGPSTMSGHGPHVSREAAYPMEHGRSHGSHDYSSSVGQDSNDLSSSGHYDDTFLGHSSSVPVSDGHLPSIDMYGAPQQADMPRHEASARGIGQPSHGTSMGYAGNMPGQPTGIYRDSYQKPGSRFTGHHMEPPHHGTGFPGPPRTAFVHTPQAPLPIQRTVSGSSRSSEGSYPLPDQGSPVHTGFHWDDGTEAQQRKQTLLDAQEVYVQEKEDELKKKQKLFDQEQKEFAERQKTLDAREEAINRREGELGTRSKKAGFRETVLQDVEGKISEKQQELANILETIQEKQQLRSRIEHDLESLQHEVQGMQEKIKLKNMELLTLDRELERMRTRHAAAGAGHGGRNVLSAGADDNQQNPISTAVPHAPRTLGAPPVRREETITHQRRDGGAASALPPDFTVDPSLLGGMSAEERDEFYAQQWQAYEQARFEREQQLRLREEERKDEEEEKKRQEMLKADEELARLLQEEMNVNTHVNPRERERQENADWEIALDEQRREDQQRRQLDAMARSMPVRQPERFDNEASERAMRHLEQDIQNSGPDEGAERRNPIASQESQPTINYFADILTSTDA